MQANEILCLQFLFEFVLIIIIPKTIIKSIPEQETELDEIKNKSKTDLKKQKIEIEIKMKTFAEDLDFENAIQCRDKIKRIQMELDKDESK